MRHFIAATFSACLFVLCLPATGIAQETPDTTDTAEAAPEQSLNARRGKELYEQGKTEDAVKELSDAVKINKNDAGAWHYLGLALARTGRNADALKVLYQAVDLRVASFQKEFARQLRDVGEVDKKTGDANRARFSASAKTAIESVEKYLELNPPDVNMWREQLRTLRISQKFADDPKFESGTFQLSKFAKKVVMTRRPEPEFPREARQYQARGAVRLRVLFGADGKVEGVIVVKSIDKAFTDSAVAAARNIKFIPASIDGQPVSQFLTVEYYFNSF